MAQPTLSDIELGKQADVTSSLLRRIARTLGCTTDYLVGMHEDEDTELLAALAG